MQCDAKENTKTFFFKGIQQEFIKENLCLLSDAQLIDLFKVVSSQINFNEVRKLVRNNFWIISKKFSLFYSYYIFVTKIYQKTLEMNNQLLANSLDVSSAISTLQTVNKINFFLLSLHLFYCQVNYFRI